VTSILWFDPGVMTGIQYGVFTDSDAYEMRKVWQVPGGVGGLRRFLHGGENSLFLHADIIGCEKWIPFSLEGMSHTLESTLPLVLEGVLVEAEIMPEYPDGNWQPATAQTLVHGSSPQRSRKLTNQLLEDKGYWMTGSMIGADDANDVNSTTRHILHYMTRTLKHTPTIEKLYGEENA
jgi:hypothetical protein